MQSFGDWLGSTVINVTIRRQHGQFYAAARLFGVVGVGRSEDEAVRDLAGLLHAYLRSYYNDSRPYADAVRAEPRGHGVAGLVALVSGLVERVFVRHRRLDLPSVLHPSH